VLVINSKQKNSESDKGIFKRALSRSIFAKYFTACASIMVVSFVVLGTAMVVLTLSYSISEKENLFYDNSSSISKIIVQAAESGDKRLMDYMGNSLSMSAVNLDATIYVCDNKGKMIFTATPQFINDDPNSTISKTYMNIINKRGTVKEESTLGGLFDSPYTVAGVPMISSDGSTVIGAVFICAKSGGYLKILSGVFRIFLFCLSLILLLAFVAIYLVTSKLVKPLRQMSHAAQSFSKGDFSTRIPVNDNDEIGQLSVAFNNMATSLTALEEMRSSFVANVSHELKTPMTSIAGFIDGILDGTIPQEKENFYLKIVSDEVKRLSRLVRSFLDIARIEAGELKINPTDFDVTELVRRVIIGFEQPISNKSLEVKGLGNDDKFMVSADFDLTYQIVYNLVDNAVKFAGKDGYIEINIAAKGKKVYVSVKNSGMGIPESDLPYVFDRFYKTDKSRSNDKKGVGLGLYIVKTVLNMQDQDIVVKSVEGEYCEFVFTLKEI
jgi:signal transduction histidine kinase